METQKLPTFGFFEYALLGLPLVLVFFIYYAVFGDRLGKRIFGDNPEHSPAMREMMDSASQGPATQFSTSKQILSSLIFVVTAVGFFTINTKVMPIGTIAMMGAFLMIATGCIPLKTTLRKFDWATMLFFCFILAFADAFNKSGAGKLIADTIVRGFGGSGSPFLIFAVFCTVCCLMTQVMNNTALASLMGPIALSLAKTLNVSPLPMAMGLIFTSSLSISTPIATSPMLLVAGLGGYKFMDYVKYGGLLNLIMLALTIILIPMIWRF